MNNISEASAVLGVGAVILSIRIGAGTLRQRATEPTERRLIKLEQRADDADKKFANDMYHIGEIEKYSARRNQFEEVTMRGLKVIIEHLADGNHSGDLKKISEEIDHYLISQAYFEYPPPKDA